MYQQIESNKRKTIWVMMSFIGVIVLISVFFGYYYNDYGIVILALIFSSVYAIIQYYLGSKMAIMMSGAKEITDYKSDYYKIVENLSITTGLPMPKVYIIEDSSLNAFATGRDPDHAAVCATSGIIERLNKRELEAVMAHEMAHVGNYDIRLNLIAFALSAVIAMLADIMFRIGFYNDKDNKDKNGALMIVGLIGIILSPIVASLIRMALSRNREYLADATAALTTRDPESLASALSKLSSDPVKLKNQNPSMAGMYINNPLRSSGLTKLFSTHPPIESRIKRLQDMKGQF